MKQLSRVLLIFIKLVLLAGCASPLVNPSTPIQPVPKPNITISAVGDIMLGTNYPDDRLAPDDGKQLLASISPFLKTADITFGNLEGVLMEGGVAAKQCKNSKSCYVFRSPPHYAQYLKEAGFDVLSLANNHARDFGEEGRSSTMTVLDELGLHHSGRLGDIARIVVKGLKVALIAYAPFGGSHDMLDTSLAQTQIKTVAKTSDIVIVSVHAGAEGNGVMRVPFKNEIFYGEDRGNVVTFSHAAIDAGADFVIGHGPHVPRALELYKGRLIAYSLGNFATYQGININAENGLAPILNVILSADGEFKNGNIISTRQVRPSGNQLDPKHSVAKTISHLTSLDFPETPLLISKEGVITLKPAVEDAEIKSAQTP